MKYIIIGGVAGGATAAARIRRNTEKAEIILFEKGEYISYANCGLPYYIGGVISDRERLFVQTPESFGKRFNIDVRTRSEVTAIDVKKKEVTVRTAGKTYTESYDKLLLSPGASPVRPPLPGIETEGIFTLRNVNDTDHIKSYMQQKAVKHAVIVGGGFIGLEMAENLHHSGIEVSVVEMANQVMGPIDYSMASLVHEHLQQKGVRLYLEQAVESFEKTAEGITVNFKSGIKVNAEMVLLSIGVRAETRLATEAGLKIGEMRGIYVNEYLQTSDESVYAVGDAIEYPHPITHKPWLNFLAGPANRQARIVADNMVFGNKIKYEGSIGTAIAKVFDLTVASTGLPAKRLKQMDIPYLSATIHSHIPIMRFLILFLFILSTSLIQAQEVLLESKIKKSIENVPAQVGVAIIINGKDTITVNNECHYPLMSVMKYPQALAVLHYLHQHNQPLSTKIFIPKEALLDDTYSPLRDKYPEGNIYMPIAQLLDYTIQKSDNNACDILFNYTGGVSYTDSYIRSLGINNFSISKTEDDMHEDLAACYENWSTPLEIASLTDMLFSKELFPTEYQNFLKETMLNCQTGTNRLPAPLLDTTARIGHKTGTSDRNVQGELIGINDVGFILLPDGKRYTIAVLVKDSTESMADTEKIIANISGIVYHHLVSEKNISNK